MPPTKLARTDVEATIGREFDEWTVINGYETATTDTQNQFDVITLRMTDPRDDQLSVGIKLKDLSKRLNEFGFRIGYVRKLEVQFVRES